MPLALLALTAGAFGIGVTEFVIMGLLPDIGADLGVSLQAAGLLISGYALGVVVGAPLVTVLTRRLPRKTVLLGLMAIFTIGNALCALAPGYGVLMAARVLTAFAHGSFFGVGSVVATGLVAPNKRASAIAVMFTGLTVANVLGVPIGTWIGQAFCWRATFEAVAAIGVVALVVIQALVPKDAAASAAMDWRHDLVVLGRRDVLLGIAAFATVAPLQAWVLRRADGAGETLASSFNIAAFNLGNALGAGIGGLVVARADGLGAVAWVAMLLPLAAIGVARIATRPAAAPPRLVVDAAG